ncbi:low affinity immunoglobulin gamma Fc region receptor III-like isoform X2 [Hippoglossus hippoglossus]|uniref:low affinity immunoglobulin gamma Fc region receptor III-like isoform X2 n=1 Tax=Hippoglossus hippoglossus TaxID=8267 RepID=UPI00148E89EC|nr:low affinity immunoglobulin gamma Fc region receptor III-like isoform X2 [Hippoglossus hippoglossus]
MKTTLLFLLTFINWTSADNQAVASLTLDRSQYFEYEDITVKCEHMDSDDWTVWRYTTKDLQMSQCRQGWGVQVTSTCDMKTVKQPTSGVYWCQSKHGHSSNAVNITVTDLPVILQSPVLPVAAGENVTLLCKTKTPPYNLPADFYKNGDLISTTPTGHMTIHLVSKSDEGAYKCDIRGRGESPPAWLLIKDDSVQASLSASPDSSQLSEYENLFLSCGNDSSFHGWTIKRFTPVSRRLSSCGDDWGKRMSSGCIVQTVKQLDSAIYWCESPARQRSNSINITVYDLPVILQSPVLPVEAGENVTLLCKTKTPSLNLSADFYKDGTFVRTTPTGHMTIHLVSKSDEGAYKCDIRGRGESPPAWLFVTGEVKAVLFEPSLTMLVIIRIVVSSPYVVSTLLLVSIVRQRPTEKAPPVSLTTPPPGEDEEGLEYEDVVADVTTEHRF